MWPSMQVAFESSLDPSIVVASLAAPLRLPSVRVDPAQAQRDRGFLHEGGQTLARQISGFEDIAYNVDLLANDAISGVQIKGLFVPSDAMVEPSFMVDDTVDAEWHRIALLVQFLIDSFNLYNVSYSCENSGRLYVHLCPQDGFSADAEKSRKFLRGHTDGSVLPISGLEIDVGLPPSPDLVVLVGLKNQARVPTRIHPLSKVVRSMQPDSIRALGEPVFSLSPQSSFELPNLTRANQRVLLQGDDGHLIRYSHSKVTYPGNDPRYLNAIEDLQEAIRTCSYDVVVEPGDVLFVNNRTAIHGRGKVSEEAVTARRWLMRTYCAFERNEKFRRVKDRPHVLEAVA